MPNPFQMGLDTLTSLTANTGQNIQQAGQQQAQAAFAQQQEQTQADQGRADQFRQLSEQYTQTQDPATLRQMIGMNPEMSGQISTQLGAIDGASRSAILNKGQALTRIIQTSPDQALQYYQEMGLANDPAFAGLLDNLEAGDFEGAKNEIGFAVTALGGNKLYDAFFPPQKTQVLKSGEQLLGAGNAVIAENIKPITGTTLEKNLLAQGLTPGTGPYEAAVEAYLKKPSGSTINIGDPLTKANAGQLSAAGFASRLSESNSQLSQLEDSGYDPANIADHAAFQAGFVGNYALSDEAQAYRGAKEDFITAVLRLESGAAIGAEEFVKEDKKYFPQPGDSAATIKLKRERRGRQFDVLKNQSKGVYDAQYGEKSKSAVEFTPTTVNWADL